MYLQHKRRNYSRIVMGLPEILSSVGGFANIIITITMFIGRKYNRNSFYSNMINSLYFTNVYSNINLNSKHAFVGKRKKLFEKAK